MKLSGKVYTIAHSILLVPGLKQLCLIVPQPQSLKCGNVGGAAATPATEGSGVPLKEPSRFTNGGVAEAFSERLY